MAVVFLSGMRAKPDPGQLEIEQALKGAVANNELVLHHPGDGRADRSGEMHAEALMRWQRPWRGLIMPGVHRVCRGKCGLIGEMGELAIREVCRQLASWSNRGYTIETVTVNTISEALRLRAASLSSRL